jgi:23S rRNA (pseudouridine1915-N3)-methyltransferase
MLIAVGRMRPGVEADVFAHYNARIRPPISVTEIAEKHGRRQEGAAILAALPPGGFVVALDPNGDAMDSRAFADALQSWGKVYFVIGGADGLDAAVLQRADISLSLGPMTWPHMLVRGMLAEQIFRARAIAAGHPYHRG